jgi:hypothetical protein
MPTREAIATQHAGKCATITRTRKQAGLSQNGLSQNGYGGGSGLLLRCSFSHFRDCFVYWEVPVVFFGEGGVGGGVPTRLSLFHPLHSPQRLGCNGEDLKGSSP